MLIIPKVIYRFSAIFPKFLWPYYYYLLFFFFAELEKLMVYLYRIAKDPEYWKRITNIWFQNLVQKYINQNSVVLA